jgi:hypothetical protein
LFNLVKTHFKNYLQFLKKPDPNTNHHKIKSSDKWRTLLVFILIDAILITPAVLLIILLEEFTNLDIDNHKGADLLNDYGLFVILLTGSLIAPLFEEIIFRLPLNYKRNYLFRWAGKIIGRDKVKKIWFNNYTLFFYLFIITFGLVHITNYKDESLAIILLAPILVLPQIIGGTIISYLRMNIGFTWGFLQHAIFNTVVLLITFYANLEEKVFIDNKDFNLRIEVAENRYGNRKNIDVNEDFEFITEIKTNYAKFNDIAGRLNWDTIESRQNYKYFNINFSIKNLEVDSDSVLQHHLTDILQYQ